MEIKVHPDVEALATDAAERIVRASAEAIGRRGQFTIALAGGSTPKLLYQRLAQDYRDEIDWAKVEVFFGDERCVPAEHPESNYRMSRETLLSKVLIPGDNVYRMRGEIEPEEAAREYGLMLKEKFGDVGLDLVLLGMGEDGHTASIFPGTPAVDETHHRVLAVHVEKSTTGRSWRITMTAPFINRAQQVMILVAGENKAKTLAQVLEGPRDPSRLPVQLIQPASDRLTWLVDAPAAGM